MKTSIFLNTLTFTLIFTLPLLGCKETAQDTSPLTKVEPEVLPPNLLSGLSEDNMQDFEWINEAEEYNIEDGSLTITAPGQSDFFINPVDGQMSNSAPVLYLPVWGDFVATTKVVPDLSEIWNATALMVFIDDTHWIKFAFENSDATGPSIVSVTTRGSSDDANGVVLAGRPEVWLKLIRKGNNYAMHWSADGQEYKMARLSAMPEADTVKLGLEAQCPAGDGAIHRFEYFSLEKKSVNDLRTGE